MQLRFLKNRVIKVRMTNKEYFAFVKEAYNKQMNIAEYARFLFKKGRQK